MNRANFVPRPASLSLRLEGVEVFRLRMENDAARALLRALRRCAALSSVDGEDDLFDLLLSALLSEATAQEQSNEYPRPRPEVPGDGDEGG